MITETIRATNGDGATRADIGADAKFTWSEGDKIAVHVSDGNYYNTLELASGSDGSEIAEFSVSYPWNDARDAFAVYPASIVATSAANYGQSGTGLDVTLPSSYTLAQVSSTTTPCPMIATNQAGSGWTFKQLCGLLRLTVSNIPASAKRLEISFDGKKVCGDFSIAAPVTPGTSEIETTNDADNDKIVITNDGTDSELGSTELVLNIPLPTGNYSSINVVAYDALSGGMPLLVGTLPFTYKAVHARGIKKAITLQPNFQITFKDPDNNVITGLRFVRIFSNLNKLHNTASSFGPFTMSSATGENDLVNPLKATLFFENTSEDEIAFQVIDADGKVYSGSYEDVPDGGFKVAQIYELTVNVKAYTFTTASGKKVYFSPGDLGVDNGVYSFTEPFTTWGHVNGSSTKRVWFNYNELNSDDPATLVYGIRWRIENYSSGVYEWNNIIGRTMNTDVSSYYKVNINGNYYCLLLPPDGTISTDIESDLTSGNVTNYVKYLGKGFVLLMNTNKATGYSTPTWQSVSHEGWYWASDYSSNRLYFQWGASNPPACDLTSQHMKLHARLVHDVN